MGAVPYGKAAFERQTADSAFLPVHLHDAPSRLDVHASCAGVRDVVRKGGHGVLGFQAADPYLRGPQEFCRDGRVHGHVAAADDKHRSADGKVRRNRSAAAAPCPHGTKKFHAVKDAAQFLAGHVCPAAERGAGATQTARKPRSFRSSRLMSPPAPMRTLHMNLTPRAFSLFTCASITAPGQAVGRDSPAQHAAGFGQCLENGDG